MKFIKNNFNYIFLFFFYFFCLTLFYNAFMGDSIANLGFSYAISKGEIPYKDFNMIIPIFSPLFYFLSLLIFKSSISFYLLQALLLTILSKILYSLLKSKSYIYLPILFMGFPFALVTAIFPGYNFMLFFLTIILIYLEERNESDFIIGIIIGLLILTKHTIGIFFILPSLLYIKNYKKILKRFIGTMLPCFIFFIYLIITNSYKEFFNLCFLGLFSFASNNFYFGDIILIITFILCLFITLRYIFKNKSTPTGYYILILSIMVYPLFDWYHISYFVLGSLYLFLKDLNINLDKTFKYFMSFTFVLAIIWFSIEINIYDKSCTFKSYNNYPLRYANKEYFKDLDEFNSFVSNSKNDVILFSGQTENYFYKITNNLEISYFDLPNYGNYGKNGEDMMIEKIKKLKKNTLIFISLSRYKDNNYKNQYDKKIVKFIVDNYEKCNKVGRWNCYVKK